MRSAGMGGCKFAKRHDIKIPKKLDAHILIIMAVAGGGPMDGGARKGGTDRIWSVNAIFIFQVTPTDQIWSVPPVLTPYADGARTIF